MSVTLMAQVYATRLGNSTLKAVALKLADYANDCGGNIWPALETIALHTEVSKSTAQRAIKGLLAAGILEVEKEGGKGPGSTTRYRFNLTKLAAAPKLRKDSHPDHDGQIDHVAKVVTVEKKVVTVTTEPSTEPLNKKDTPPTPSARGRPRKPKSLLPEDWTLPDAWREWASTHSPARALWVSAEADKFADHWRSIDGRKADWEATWRNWWRRACEQAPPRQSKAEGAAPVGELTWGGKPHKSTDHSPGSASVRDTSEPWPVYKARMIREGKIKPETTA